MIAFTMILMQLTTQLFNYHVLIHIIICYEPEEEIILLSPSELKSYFISLHYVLIAIILFLMKGHLYK